MPWSKEECERRVTQRILEGKSKLGFPTLVEMEILRARNMYPKPQNSAHEGFSVLMEEVDELWELVRGRTKRTDGSGGRDPKAMLEELVQIGAMAQRMAEDVFMNHNSV